MCAGSVWFLKSNQLTREPIKLSKGHKHHNKGEILKFNISVNSKFTLVGLARLSQTFKLILIMSPAKLVLLTQITFICKEQ